MAACRAEECRAEESRAEESLAEDLARIARQKQAVSVTVYRNGPYLVRGGFSIVDGSRGELPRQRQTVALCSCGRSRAKPFCDGSHKAIRTAALRQTATWSARGPRSEEAPDAQAPSR